MLKTKELFTDSSSPLAQIIVTRTVWDLGGRRHGPHLARPSSFQGLVKSTSFLTCLPVLTFIFLKSTEHTNQPRPEDSSFTRSPSHLAPLMPFHISPNPTQTPAWLWRHSNLALLSSLRGKARLVMVCDPCLPSTLPLSAPFAFSE